jgi:hypothetical protein
METLNIERDTISLEFRDDEFLNTAFKIKMQNPHGTISYLVPTLDDAGNMSLKVQNRMVEASGYETSSTTSKESLADLSRFNIDAEGEIIKAIDNESLIASQRRLKSIYYDLGKKSRMGSYGKWKSFLNKHLGIDFPLYVSDDEDICKKIFLLSNLIAAGSRRGPANFIIVSGGMWARIALDPSCVIYENNNDAVPFIRPVGNIANKINVFVDSSISFNNGLIIMGIKTESPYPGVLFGQYSREVLKIDSYDPFSFLPNVEYKLIERYALRDFGDPEKCYYTNEILNEKKPLWRRLIGA